MKQKIDEDSNSNPMMRAFKAKLLKKVDIAVRPDFGDDMASKL